MLPHAYLELYMMFNWNYILQLVGWIVMEMMLNIVVLLLQVCYVEVHYNGTGCQLNVHLLKYPLNM